MTKVNAILIGVQKAGTSALHTWLSEHPQICAPTDIKDLHFFTRDNLYPKGGAYLESFFADGADKPVWFHSAVNYFFHGRTAASRIHEYNPDARLVLVLRNPVDRAISSYHYHWSLGRETLPLREAFAREREAVANGRADGPAYIAHGFYAQSLEAFLEFFPAESIKIFVYEVHFRDQPALVREVCEFLGVDDFLPSLKQVNRTSEPRSRVLQAAVRKISANPTMKRLAGALPPLVKYRMVKSLKRLNSSGRPIKKTAPEDLESQLRELYAEDVTRVSRLTGFDLNGIWKIDAPSTSQADA